MAPYLAIKVQLIDIPVNGGVNKDTFTSDAEDDFFRNNKVYPLAVKISACIAVDNDGEQLENNIWLKRIETLLYPWNWQWPIGAQEKWKGKVLDDEDVWKELAIHPISTNAIDLFQDPDGGDDTQKQALLNEFKTSTNSHLDEIVSRFYLNPSAAYAAQIDDATFSSTRYLDAPGQTVHEALEELGQLPAAFAFHLELVEYLLVGIDNDIALPVGFNEDKPAIVLAPHFGGAQDGLEWTLEPDVPGLPIEISDARRGSVWTYNYTDNGADSTNEIEARALITLPWDFTPPGMMIALEPVEAGRLMELRTGGIKKMTTGHELLQIESAAARTDAQERINITDEVYSEDWVALLPQRLVAAYDPLGALLDFTRAKLSDANLDNIWTLWKALSPGLLRERLGSGILARLGEAIPLEDWREDLMEMSEIPRHSADVQNYFDRVAAGLAQYETELWKQNSKTWFTNVFKPVLKGAGEYTLANQLATDFNVLATPAKVLFGNMVERLEKAARLVSDNEVIAKLLLAEWSRCANEEFSFSEKGTPLFTALTWAEPTGTPPAAILSTVEYQGLIDLTSKSVTALHLNGLVEKLTDGQKLIWDFHNTAQAHPVTLASDMRIELTYVSDGQAKLVLEAGVNSTDITFAGGDEPLTTYTKITDITLVLSRKTPDPTVQLYVQTLNGDDRKTGKTVPVDLVHRDTNPVSAQMWLSLRGVGISPEIKIAQAALNRPADFDPASYLPDTTNLPGLIPVAQLIPPDMERHLGLLSPVTILADPVLGPIWLTLSNNLTGTDIVSTGREIAKDRLTELIKERLKNGTFGLQLGVAGGYEVEFQNQVVKRAKTGIQKAFPEREGGNKRRTATRAHPIAVRFDHLSSINDDRWSDIQGFSYFVGFEPEITDSDPITGDPGSASTHWVSLNTSIQETESATSRFIIDPQPLNAIEVGGVRQSILSFDNRNLLAMTGDPSSKSNTKNPNLDLLTNAFPTGWRMPHLAYGSKLALYGYLSLHAGILPEILRDDHPARLKLDNFPPTPKPRPGYVGDRTLPGDEVHVVHYLRRVPVGAPRLEDRKSKLNGQDPLLKYPESIRPLATELERRESVFTLRPDETKTLFQASEVDAGLIDINDGEALALDFYEVTLGEGQSFQTSLMAIESETEAKKYSITIKKSNVDSDVFNITENIVDGVNGLFVTVPRSMPVFSVRLKIQTLDGGTKASGCLSHRAHKCFDGDAWHEIYTSDADILPACNASKDGVEAPQVPGMSEAWLVLLGATDETSLQPPKLRVAGDAIEPAEQQPDIANIVITQGEKIEICRIRPPALDFKTWAPGIVPRPSKAPNHGGSTWDVNQNDTGEQDTRAILTKAHRVTYNDVVDGTKIEDRAFDDPQSKGLYVEMVQIFPSNGDISESHLFLWPVESREPDKFFEDFQKSGVSIKVSTLTESNGSAPMFSVSDTEIHCKNLIPGTIIELRFHATSLASEYHSGSSQVFEPALAEGTRQVNSEILSEPLKIRIEVPTTIQPDAKILHNLFSLNYDASRGAHLHLDLKLDPPAPLADRKPELKKQIQALKALRYYQFYRLPPQKWSWFGRPLPVWGEEALISGAPNAFPQCHWQQIAFAGREDSQVGPMPGGNLTREHLPSASKNLCRLHEERLDYIGKAQFWRFRLEVESRYQAFAGARDLTVIAQTDCDGQSHPWAAVHVPSASSIASITTPAQKLETAQNVPPRPPVELILPLTEPLDIDGRAGDWAIPPLLVIFDRTFYESGDISDRLEVLLDTARHPLIPSDGGSDYSQQAGDPTLLQQAGPDPILHPTGFIPHTNGHNERGTVLPLRHEGVIGYTQSPLNESADQRRAAMLISIDEQAIAVSDDLASLWQQWPMIKLQLRRYHDPFLDENSLELKTIGSGTTPQEIENTGLSTAYYLPVPEDAPSINMTFKTSDANKVELSAAISGETLTLKSSGKTGSSPFMAGDLILSNAVTSSGFLRVIVTPVGEADGGGVKNIFITTALSTGGRIKNAQQRGFDPWLSGTPLSLDISGVELETELDISLPAGQDYYYWRGPIRISDVTEPIWCQFSSDSSKFRWELTSSVDASQETVILRTEQLQLQDLFDENPKLSPSDIGAASASAISAMMEFQGQRPLGTRAQVSAPERFEILAVIFKWITDAAGRPVEQFAGVARINRGENSPADTGIMEEIHPLLGDPAPGKEGFAKLGLTQADNGCVRLFTILLSPQAEASLGAAQIFKTLFNSNLPSEQFVSGDATHIVIGISRPINYG